MTPAVLTVRCIRVIESCKTREQLDVAREYVRLCKRRGADDDLTWVWWKKFMSLGGEIPPYVNTYMEL